MKNILCYLTWALFTVFVLGIIGQCTGKNSLQQEQQTINKPRKESTWSFTNYEADDGSNCRVEIVNGKVAMYFMNDGRIIFKDGQVYKETDIHNEKAYWLMSSVLDSMYQRDK